MHSDQTVTPDPSVRKVLIYRLGSLGDTVVALPCFHLIERKFPNAERRLLTNFPIHAKAPASAAVLGDSGLVHGYMRYTVGTRSAGELLRLAREIRRFKPDVLVYLMPVRSTASVQRDKWFFRVACGVRHIVGIPVPEQLERIENSSTGMYQSEAVRLALTVSALGDAGVSELKNWSLRLTDSERNKARTGLGQKVGQPLVVCGPGTKMQAKDWGQENWRLLMEKLSSAYPGFGLAMIGAKEDSEVSEYAAAAWLGPKVNLCGILSPRETAAVLEHAAVFLGPDSGPMHLAACAGVPCVIAFAARGLPGVWYPAGSQHRVIYHKVDCFGCNLETCIEQDRKCLTSITVDEMADAVAAVMAKRTEAV
ncbi:glycosyltransferase family 9 protein [Acidicapsa dinghuensis]|uniref:Glycosyltransferase family 9 protein n=1 Tax=Acidicapsa dinghuensis TaxID=2218256 RepID=A0ABW1EKP9_9BACT|nr:glycosyltransferase family 9 protein [Acidicapsa dinghuensis]